MIDESTEFGARVARGTVGHNAFRTDFGIASGGFKQSGIGREGGIEGLHPFLETLAFRSFGVLAQCDARVRLRAES